jgi:pyrimidine-nucleoside phosphorylase
VTGYLASTACEDFGTALALLGGGRARKEDRIDLAVGLEFHKRIGDRVERGEPLATIHYNSGDNLEEARRMISGAFVLAIQVAGARAPLIRRVIGG